MGRALRCCLQATLKVVNSVIGMVGMAMILYALWMIRDWNRQTDGSGALPPPDSSPQWFMYTSLGLGIFLCLIACSGHIAAETANAHCLSCYMVFALLLVLLEAAIAADVFLNRNWEEDFPKDPTGRFDEFKNFVRSNPELCKWIGLSVIATQALSIFLAMVLRALGPDPVRETYYDSDDENVPARLPLLLNQVQQAARAPDPNRSTKY